MHKNKRKPVEAVTLKLDLNQIKSEIDILCKAVDKIEANRAKVSLKEKVCKPELKKGSMFAKVKSFETTEEGKIKINIEPVDDGRKANLKAVVDVAPKKRGRPRKGA